MAQSLFFLIHNYMSMLWGVVGLVKAGCCYDFWLLSLTGRLHAIVFHLLIGGGCLVVKVSESMLQYFHNYMSMEVLLSFPMLLEISICIKWVYVGFAGFGFVWMFMFKFSFVSNGCSCL